MKKRMALLLAAIMLIASLAGCMTREADKVNHNMNVAADNFSCERRITVYNARTDKIILYAEGYAMAFYVRSGNYCPSCGAKMDGGVTHDGGTDEEQADG